MLHIVHLEQAAAQRAALNNKLIQELYTIHYILFMLCYIITLVSLVNFALPERIAIIASVWSVWRLRSIQVNLNFNAWLFKETTLARLLIFFTHCDRSTEETLAYFEKNFVPVKELLIDESCVQLRDWCCESVRTLARDADTYQRYFERYPKILAFLEA